MQQIDNSYILQIKPLYKHIAENVFVFKGKKFIK